MKDFARKGPFIRVRLSEYEATLLESLLDQLTGLLGVDDSPPAADDPFERWQAEFSETGTLDDTDPVIERLFPAAYRDDPSASAEFRRFTQARQRQDRIDQAELVMTALRDSDGGHKPVQVRVIEVDQWLKVLTAVRLSLAVRLGIESAADADELDGLGEDDPRSYVYRVYEWIGYLSEGLLSQA
ncbi:MAG: DUF2017 family protein [Propionicimonas sp.]|nr:DUF2017 family protein [Propionicimonas sp.]